MAGAFAKQQLPSGTWGRTDPGDGKTDATDDKGFIYGLGRPETPDFDAAEVLWMLGQARLRLGTDAFRAAEDKAYAWLKEHGLKTCFWRDQGHHGHAIIAPHKLTGRCATCAALYLLDCRPQDADPALIAERARFAEDRHVDWSRCAAEDPRIGPLLVDAKHRESGASVWMGSRLALVWQRMHRAAPNPCRWPGRGR